VLSSSDISKLSSIELVNRGLYSENRESVPYGPLDLKLGVNEKGKTCNTCSKKIVDCPGHFGYIRLALPIFHIGYFKYIINILQCICKTCAKVLLKKEDKDNFKRSLFAKRHKSSKAREKIFKSIIEMNKKIKNCEYCGAVNGAVKHIQATEATLIIHDRYK
jgi:DNA-directed RNA polymerase III subunit RPC1